ncbi:putative UDP-galactose 4-epimerase [Pedobacter sp. BAL39]|uniref:NAD-dependent epimerase/dehydratase family protein n=1 Tax=Pedobacter sp. BAL39 TaxID=391596 RepID=UPI000155970A|nr:NAD-dependent epimerase/dehydratase family protein [Pedobacter sp. BAL39]EDM37178.1 putative UDP-galactose 4-epimerase [Pedobacter sp. BAL39]
MNILLTGASGFLGKYIVHTFHQDKVVRLGRGQDEDITCDLSTKVPVISSEFDLVVHAAGKAHSVPKTAAEKKSFFDVNVAGTRHLLAAIDKSGYLPKSFVFISSVSVYGLESGNNIPEDWPLKANDAYGMSKIQSEILAIEWCARNNVTCSILRLPLLAGSNPPGNLGAMIRGIRSGYYFNIAGGKAKKSMVLADDVARILNRVKDVGGIYNLTDGYHPAFCELSKVISDQINRTTVLNMPLWIARLAAKVGDFLGNSAPINSLKLKKIQSDLTFDDTKARKMLGWQPREVLKNFTIDDL